jgi:type IV pilus assembly protein PilM
MQGSWSAAKALDQAWDAAAPSGNAGGFDPYRMWLGVRELRRPLNAYQLLGLATLESDMALIRSAAGVQRTAMDAKRFGASPQIWEQVHGELEEAIGLLLDPLRKEEYDDAIRRDDRAGAITSGKFEGGRRSNGDGHLLTCSQCGAPVPANRKFCGQCGFNLWEACFQCQTLCLAGEPFCGSCGADLKGHFENHVRQFEEAFQQADELRFEGRYGDAIALLSPLTKVDHPRLEAQARQAIGLIRQIGSERQTRLAEVEILGQEARRSVETCDYEGAVGLLEGVPEPLRDDDLRRLLREASTLLDEVNLLTREIAEAISAGRSSNLLSKIERLLTIKPDHPQATQLAQRLEQRLFLVAKEKSAACQYEAALALLEQVPRQVRGEQFEAVRSQVQELIWLVSDLKNAPVADATLAALAERLLRLSPRDSRAAKALAEIRRRLTVAEGDPRRAVVPWAAAKEQTRVGCGVDWLTDFRRFHFDEKFDAAVLAANPGGFFPACGLALQSLRLSRTKINLHPNDPSLRARLRKLGQMRLRQMRSGPKAWGLDLGASGLKAMRVSMDKSQQNLTIEACDLVPHRKLLSEAVNEEEERALIEETLKEFLSRNDLKGCRIGLGLPGRTVLVRQLSLPAIEPKKLASAVQYEMRRQISIPLDDLVWGYEVLGSSTDDLVGAKKNDVVIVAARRIMLKDRLSRLGSAGMAVDVVQGDAVALYNFLAYDYFGDAEAPTERVNEVTAVLDLGSDTMNVLIGSPRLVWLHGSGFGCHNFSKALVRQQRLTLAQADELLRDPLRAESLFAQYQILEPVFEELAKQIETAFAQFSRAHRHAKITRLLGVGGGFRIHGLFGYLRSYRPDLVGD